MARVCVYGPGGIGKTEFGKMVATWMNNRGHVCTVFWTSVDSAESSNNILDLLSLIELTKSFLNISSSDPNVERQKQLIYHYLRKHPTLFVIDGWENLNSKNRWPVSKNVHTFPFISRNKRFTHISFHLDEQIGKHVFRFVRRDERICVNLLFREMNGNV